MYNIYTNDEHVANATTAREAKRRAISLFNTLGKDIFVWSNRKGQKSELILEVIDDNCVPTTPFYVPTIP